MNRFKQNLPEQNESFVLVPRAWLESLAENQQKILEHLEGKQKPNLTGEYISEKEAIEELGKKSTWFWNKRKSGELPFVKVGGKVWYHQADLLRLFSHGQ